MYVKTIKYFIYSKKTCTEGMHIYAYEGTIIMYVCMYDVCMYDVCL